MTRIAICMRGSLRTWDVCKKSIFYHFDFSKYSDVQVDWFFDAWDTDGYTYYDIDPETKEAKAERVIAPLDTKTLSDQLWADFREANRNLVTINFHKFDAELSPAESFMKLVYLSNISKRSRELCTNSRYDVVVQIRPDVIYKFIEHSVFHNPDDYRYGLDYFRESVIESKDHYVLNYEKKISEIKHVRQFSSVFLDPLFNTVAADIPPANDIVFFGKSQVIDVVSECYKFVKEKKNPDVFPHATIFQYLSKYGIIINDFCPTWQIVRNMKIRGKYDYQYYLEHPEKTFPVSDEFYNGVTECTNIWYILFKTFKII